MATQTTVLSPGVLSLLPIFYIGWSDSILSPSEIEFMHKKINSIPFLSEEEKAYLIQYTNPQNPPSPEIFKFWLDALKKYSRNASITEKQSLADLGLEIARSAVDYRSEEIWKSPKVYQSVKEIEDILDINYLDNLRAMLTRLGMDFSPKTPDSFDTRKMAKILDGSRHEIKNKTKRLLRDPYFKPEFIPDKESHRQRVLEMLRELSQRGYGALAFPKEYGGQDNMGAYMAIFETLAYHDNSLTVKFGVQFGLFGGAIKELGTDRHHRKYLEPIGKAELLGCFAMTETGHGSNVKDLETTATYNEEDDTITVHSPTKSSGKEYIGNALHGSLAVVFAQLIIKGENHGIHAVLVPYRDKDNNLLHGITVKDCGFKMGLNGVDNGRLWFDNIKVPKENLLNRFGDIDDKGSYASKIKNPNKRFFLMLGALVGGRICVGLAGLNAAKTSLAIAVKYALRRRQFGKDNEGAEWLIMDYPSHQHRLIPLVAKTYTYYMAMTRLSDQYASMDADADIRKIETKAAGLKAMATWHTTATIQECREACGGKGYLMENRFTQFKGDTDIFTTFEGDNTVLLQLVAKGLLTEFKESFHNEGAIAVMRYLSKKVNFTFSELNPITKRNTSIEHLMSDEFHRDALRYREKKLLITLSDRMRSYLSKRVSPFDALLKCQDHMIELAKAYIERLAYSDAIKKIDDLKHSPEKEALTTMIKLFAITIIQENKGFYLENDYMDGTKSKAIRHTHNKLIKQIRNDIELYIDSFNIPLESIGAEIILNSYNF
jgi:acyl-CoA oxidase